MDELQSILQCLTKEEQQAVIRILQEQAKTGSSSSYNSLISADYDEIPVSVEEFISNSRYAGNYLQSYYPFWKEQLINIFDKGKHYSEVAFTGSIGTGKALRIDSDILTPNGFVKLANINVGDNIIGEDGHAHKVIGVWPQGKLPLYRVTFADKSYVDCNLQHEWTVRDGNNPKNSKKEDRWITRDLSWIKSMPIRINEGKVDKHGHSRSQRRWAIPVTKPVHFQSRGKLPIHPYILGQMIADGCLSGGQTTITLSDADVVDKLSKLASSLNCELVLQDYDNGINYAFRSADKKINLLRRYAKDLGIQVTAAHKHIPEVYLYASVEDRIQLLQGLFDGDGSIQGKSYTYSTISEQLYKDMTFLIESLGGYVFRTEGESCWRTENGVKHFTGNKCWEFYFRLPDAIKPFTSKKHSKRYDNGTKFNTKHIYRYIESIEYIGDYECQCITVDNPSGLYITKDFIVTHNSSMAIVGMGYVLYQLMCLKNPQKYWGTNKTMYFAFFNNNLDLAKSVGFAAFHDLIRKSEWFLENGEFRGKVNQVYHPYKDIELMAGSLPSHVIGKDVFCLTGDTIIVTETGNYTIRKLAKSNQEFKVVQTDSSGNLVLSEYCKAVKTTTVHDIYEIEFENGYSISCTAQHKFFNNRLWYQEAQSFHAGDYLYSNDGSLKIISIRNYLIAEGIDVYDVINAYPHNNFGVILGDKMVFAHNCALQDEINFGSGNSVHLEQNKIMLTYNNIYERIASRFTRDGVNWGTMFLVSSKKSEYDFLESYIRKQKGKPHFYVADAKLWDVKPMGMYSGKKFNLAVGGSNLPSKIIPDNEDPRDYTLQGYEVIQVPIEHKQSFELDMQSAIMNVAGISISQFLKFMNIEQIQKCYTADENPFTQEIIPIGLKDSTLISDYFRPNLVPEEIYSRPIFIHLDMAVSGDNAGIGAVASMGFVNTSEYDIGQGKVVDTRKMAYRHVFSVGISAPKNDQIHFAKVREFLYWLKFHLGWNIRGISADGFNSVDMRQQLSTMGFNDVSLVSLDRTSDGYMALRSAIAEKRIALLKLQHLEVELVQLERDNVTGKIDHPVNGSKDESDGLAGALYNALLHEKELANDMSDLVDTMVEMNQVIPSISQVITTQQIENTVDPQKMTKEEIIAEAKRRATIQYGRERVGYRDDDDEPFNPSDGILI